MKRPVVDAAGSGVGKTLAMPAVPFGAGRSARRSGPGLIADGTLGTDADVRTAGGFFDALWSTHDDTREHC